MPGGEGPATVVPVGAPTHNRRSGAAGNALGAARRGTNAQAIARFAVPKQAAGEKKLTPLKRRCPTPYGLPPTPPLA